MRARRAEGGVELVGMRFPEDGLLSVETVEAYLVDRGLLDAGGRVDARELGGGVSNIVLSVRQAGRGVVVKQALPRLQVADEWLADPHRAASEAEALRVTASLTPAAVPPLIDVDAQRCALVIEEAPGNWRNWKSALLDGHADPGVAERLGAILSVWQRETWEDRAIAGRLPAGPFEQLRIDPYYRTVMRRHPRLAPYVQRSLDRLLGQRRCLVHGDYSPKNVLVGPDAMWVLDFEAASFGDPAFDVAFMLNHLMLKAIHRSSDRAAYVSCARAFWDAYRQGLGPSRAPSAQTVLGHVGCLMVARVDGKSPVEYLDGGGPEQARSLGATLLVEPPGALGGAWRLLDEVLT